MTTEIVAGMREETARDLERLRREVLMTKQELRDRFEYYFSVLREKHLEMEAKLDEVVRVAETQVTDRQIKLNQLIITKAEVAQNLIHNELNQTLVNVSRELDEKIQGLEVIVDQVPSVWLEWRDEWLAEGMAKLCRVSEGVSYVNRHNPVCSGANRGEGRNEIYNPYGLSTDRHNGDVYVCDCMASNRIQVFTPLNSPHITQDTTLRDLKIATSLFVVLFRNCNYPIQTFSRDGNLKQVITSQDQLSNALYLCVDRHLNIIVSDWGADNLKVFSIEGHLLTTIGQEGEGPGKFCGPRCIDVDKEGRIVVDRKQSHMLQFF